MVLYYPAKKVSNTEEMHKNVNKRRNVLKCDNCGRGQQYWWTESSCLGVEIGPLLKGKITASRHISTPHTHTHTHTQSYPIRTDTHIHTHKPICTHTHTCTYLHSAQYIWTYINTHIHILTPWTIHTDAHKHAHIDIHTHARAWMVSHHTNSQKQYYKHHTMSAKMHL